MRRAFLSALTSLAESDARIVFLTADLGFTVVENFQAKFPDRFINTGVSEQNLLAVSTGLAKEGLIPFVYSIIPFVTLRPFEFIRNGPVLHQLPVRIIGSGSGFEYGHDGLTHYGLEDIGVLRTQPGMRIVVPADHEQAQNALNATYQLPGPIYYRLGKNETATIAGLNGRFGNGTPVSLVEGADILLLACGAITGEAVKASGLLGLQGLRPAVALVDTLQPLDRQSIAALVSKYRMVATVEAHYISGGLGSAIAEIIAEEKLDSRLMRIGVDRLWDGVTGSESFLLSRYGLSAEKIAERILKVVS